MEHINHRQVCTLRHLASAVNSVEHPQHLILIPRRRVHSQIDRSANESYSIFAIFDAALFPTRIVFPLRSGSALVRVPIPVHLPEICTHHDSYRVGINNRSAIAPTGAYFLMPGRKVVGSCSMNWFRCLLILC